MSSLLVSRGNPVAVFESSRHELPLQRRELPPLAQGELLRKLYATLWRSSARSTRSW